MVIDDPAMLGRLARIAEVFTPSHPVRLAEVFAGRTYERDRLTRAILEPGRHAVLYGSRGVGKTSLANITTAALGPGAGLPPQVERLVVRVPCTRDDDFDSLWKRVAGEVVVLRIRGLEEPILSLRTSGSGYVDEDDSLGSLLATADFLTPPMIEKALRGVERLVLVFDEYDRIGSTNCNTAFADLLKMFSDSVKPPSIVLVGVATDIEALVGAHESVERCTEQIFMSPMTDNEIREAVLQGFGVLDFLAITNEAVEAIVGWARGFPAFAHAMAKAACESVVRARRDLVEPDDVTAGAISALEAVPYSLGERYQAAVFRRHPADSTDLTLLAAAMLNIRFRPSDVARVLHRWGIDTTVRNVTNHCRALCTDARGAVLRPIGESKPGYEFSDPMMVPYVAIENWERISAFEQAARETQAARE